MSNVIVSPEMSLQIPVTNVDPGPDFANNVNASLLLIDSHNHSAGQGVQIGPSGININADLSFLNNNAIQLRSTRYQAQSVPLSLVADYLSLSVSGVDLYYLDGNGNSVRITQSGGVAGSPGSIGSLTAPASATYVSGTPAFVFQSDSNTPADIDGGSFVFRNITANSKGITVSAPAALAADYALKWPAALPGATVLLTLDNAGNIGASASTVISAAVISALTIGSGGPLLTYNSGLGVLLTSQAIQIGTSSFAFISALGDDRTLTVGNAAGTNSRSIVVSQNPSDHGLLLVRGVCNSGGTIASGEGFTLSRSSAGTYVITYSTSFSGNLPAITAMIFDLAPTSLTILGSSGLSSATILIFNAVGALTDHDFQFIAVGQRG